MTAILRRPAATLVTDAAVARRRRLRLGISGWLAVVVLALVVVIAVFAPLLAPHDPLTGNLLEPFAPPSGQHWLGTDATGRDVAARLIFGARTSLLGPLAIVGLSLAVGVPLALGAAWKGGAVLFAVNRVLDVVFAVPGILLAVLAVALFGPGLWPAVLSLAIAYLPYVARLTVTAAERERRLPYVQVLGVQGHSAVRICSRHILRNLAPVIAGQATVTFAYALIDLASLSFLGLAVQAPQPDWGVLVSDRDAVLKGHSVQVIAAGVAIVVTVMALFTLGSRLSGERPSARGWLRRTR